jgi:hypothetical protein
MPAHVEAMYSFRAFGESAIDTGASYSPKTIAFAKLRSDVSPHLNAS